MQTALTVVAAAGCPSNPLGLLAGKVGEEEFSATTGAGQVVLHLVQHVCLVLQKGRVGDVLEEVLVGHQVPRRVEDSAGGRQPIPARPADLLVIRLNVPRCAVMDDPANVRFVDAHAKSHCRYHHLHPVVEEVCVGPLAHLQR
uniref:Uncharacterized protein n=1 Tax=Ixodes ricinus TaxID=34613 RepID=A0A6B0UV52_IXORI